MSMIMIRWLHAKPTHASKANARSSSNPPLAIRVRFDLGQSWPGTNWLETGHHIILGTWHHSSQPVPKWITISYFSPVIGSGSDTSGCTESTALAEKLPPGWLGFLFLNPLDFSFLCTQKCLLSMSECIKMHKIPCLWRGRLLGAMPRSPLGGF